ncbi:hypothetical protein [Pseudonocardia sp. GCM10023141]|uniref:hypothetical protein n=1 Tax=Pseudonocardia sp. GCM10023141 TaxID=3252653 RepID=UPI003609BB39
MSRTLPDRVAPAGVPAAGAPADLLAAAFGAAPHEPVRMGRSGSPRDRWLAAVVLGGQGRYAAAATLLEGLLADGSVPAGTAAHAAVTLASHRRQLGGHAVARGTDALGLRLAIDALRGPRPVPEPDQFGTDPLAARIDALVGLAADAVGTAAPGVALRLLDTAGSIAADHPSWRTGVRIGWVRAELALLRGRPEEAVEPAAAALALATGAGAVRHRVKSSIIHTVAAAAADALDPVAALAALDEDTAACVRSGLLPLLWPCHFATADLVDRLDGADGGTTNERVTRTAQPSVGDTPTDAARRRHAAAATLSVIYQLVDPRGRSLMGDSLWRT